MTPEESHSSTSGRKKILEHLVGGRGCLFGVAWLALIAGIVYVIIHFIVKFW